MARKVLKVKQACGACGHAFPLPTQSDPSGGGAGPLFFCRAPIADAVVKWTKRPYVLAGDGAQCPTWAARP